MIGFTNERTIKMPSVESESAPGSISKSRYKRRSRPASSLALPTCKYQWVSDVFIRWVRRSRLPDSNWGPSLYPSTTMLRIGYGAGKTVALFTPLEPEARLELATFTLQKCCSTAELSRQLAGRQNSYPPLQ